MFLNNSIKKKCLLVISSLCLSACSSPVTSSITSVQSVTDSQKINYSSIVENYSNIVYFNYLDSLNEIKKFQKEVNLFIANPTKQGFETLKNTWLNARIPYEQSEGYRFYEGPIDDENLGRRINSGMVDEGFIDYVKGNKSAGIINNIQQYTVIDKNSLIELNKKENVLGFHIIEFLLWGQDLSEGIGNGEREYTDYLTVKGTNSNQARRATYLSTATNILVEDLEKLVNEWNPDKTDNYRSSFLKLDSKEAVGKILKGIESLSNNELSEELISLPLNISEIEEEHSCFSNSTQSDLLQNTKSIQNILNGTYTKSDGTTINGDSLYNLLNTTNPALALKLKNQVNQSYMLVSQIRNPFDQEIRSDNPDGIGRVKAALESLESTGETISETIKILGITKE